MKSILVFVAVCLAAFVLHAEAPPKIPKRIGTTENFRQLLLGTKWSWHNATANVPDRECVFMPDGTFRHPHFVADFTIKDINIVELHRKGGGQAKLTFDPTYTSFEAIDFENHRITGKRL